MRAETAIDQWEDGRRRLAGASPAERRLLERACDRVVDELRRRLGGTFSTPELAELYWRGTDWSLPVVSGAAAALGGGWDPQVVTDAAFALYARDATDYAGGRRTLG